MNLESGTTPFDRDRAIPYSVGLIFASVCAPEAMPLETVVQQVNETHPTGLDHGWAIADADTFMNGAPNPGPCDHDPTRKHVLLSC